MITATGSSPAVQIGVAVPRLAYRRSPVAPGYGASARSTNGQRAPAEVGDLHYPLPAALARGMR
jgi:hypothetical protein